MGESKRNERKEGRGYLKWRAEVHLYSFQNDNTFTLHLHLHIPSSKIRLFDSSRVFDFVKLNLFFEDSPHRSSDHSNLESTLSRQTKCYICSDRIHQDYSKRRSYHQRNALSSTHGFLFLFWEYGIRLRKHNIIIKEKLRILKYRTCISWLRVVLIHFRVVRGKVGNIDSDPLLKTTLNTTGNSER